jgi:O-glycosyl hydrolase
LSHSIIESISARACCNNVVALCCGALKYGCIKGFGALHESAHCAHGHGKDNLACAHHHYKDRQDTHAIVSVIMILVV